MAKLKKTNMTIFNNIRISLGDNVIKQQKHQAES